jgi:small conductance mechanosensitive channel
MPRQFKPRKDLNLDRMFETRSEAWEAAGLSVGFNERVVKRARREAMVLVPLFIAILIFWGHHWEILGHISYVHHHLSHLRHHSAWPTVLLLLTIIAMVTVGWTLSRDLGKLAGPTFMRRMDPATAGTVGFVVRIIVVVIIVFTVLSVVGTSIKTLAVGGGFTAVVVGLAATRSPESSCSARDRSASANASGCRRARWAARSTGW